MKLVTGASTLTFPLNTPLKALLTFLNNDLVIFELVSKLSLAVGGKAVTSF